MKIKENCRELLPEFIRLNEEWVREYFTLEEEDRVLAQDPGKIIDDGGYIFSIEDNDEVVGVCALFFEDERVYELARMAVSKNHQGNGYANVLMDIAIRKLESLSAKRVFLVSNTKLKTAISLYKKFGFCTTFEGQHPIYSRGNIVMERLLV